MAGISKAQELDPEGTSTVKKRLDPLQMLELRKAVIVRATKVTLGRKTFLIKYEDHSLFYYAEKGFVPCGWMSIKRVENYVQDMQDE